MEETETKTPIECEDCGTVLRSEWHRHPSRHDCKADSGVKCPDCGTLLRSSWYLPPSRHSCLSTLSPVTASSHNQSIDTAQEAGQKLRPRKKRTLSEDNNSNAYGKTPKVDADHVAPSPKLKVETGERKATPKFYSCPLDGCSRKCETKKLLMLHLAISHFMVKMESRYISSAGKLNHTFELDLLVCYVMLISEMMLDNAILEDGRRKCPHCDIIQPSNKIGFIRHVAMEHENVMENLAKEFKEKVAKEKEENDTNTVEDAKEVLNDDKTKEDVKDVKDVLNDDRTEEETRSEASKTETVGDKVGETSDPDSEKEKAIMECDPMMENK